MKCVVVTLFLSMSLLACSLGPRTSLNPPRLVMDGETDMAIQLFMQATIVMAKIYGFDTIQYSEIRERSTKAGFNTLPFMPPVTVRATPELTNLVSNYQDGTPLIRYLQQQNMYVPTVKYYIRTGLRASQLICRNYLQGLDENNQYLEFLRKEFGVAYGLATGILEAVHANRTLTNAFAIGHAAINNGIGVYEEFRFLNIDREAARGLVEATQNRLAQFYMDRVDKASSEGNLAVGGATFSDAINAVSVIEYQCTRQGIRNLLNRSINNTPSNLNIDQETGAIIFNSTLNTQKPLTDTTGAGTLPQQGGGVPKQGGGSPKQGGGAPTNSGSGKGQQSSGTFILHPMENTAEPRIRLTRGMQIQQALCVIPADGDFGDTFQSQTRVALRAFKFGFSGRSVGENEGAVLNPADLLALDRAVTMRTKNGIIPPCVSPEPSDAQEVGARLRQQRGANPR